MSKRTIDINVPLLGRVEGEGALHLRIADGAISELQLQIFEPPRYFEKFLEGRPWHQVPDIVARICGICPVAYQMSASHAIEQAFGCDPGPWVRSMRRLFYCGEWLQSHALHIHLLALPDFLGYENAIAMAADHPGEVRRGLALQGVGNEIMRLFGARSVHPVGARVGGLHHAPAVGDIVALGERLAEALPEVEALVRWLAALAWPADEQAFTSVALRHPTEYPLNEGRLVSDSGIDIAIAAYRDHFSEHQVPHSTALHSLLEGRPYLVGPLARLNLNHDRLPAGTAALLADIAAQHGIAFPSRNMFHSALARALEMHFAVVEALAICADYRVPERPFVEPTPRAGIGYGCTEAPRGILWHRYQLDGEGRVVECTIVPPTSQNQARIEEDLRLSLEAMGLESPEEALRLRGEQVIRNYDPCISCSVHFLRLSVERD